MTAAVQVTGTLRWDPGRWALEAGRGGRLGACAVSAPKWSRPVLSTFLML